MDKEQTTKEVHYLDRWPHVIGSEAQYIEGFPQDKVSAAKANATAQLKAAGVPLESLERASGVLDAYAHLTHNVAFFDGSPNYLPVAHVPPRASQIMPHARFVVVLRVRLGLPTCSCADPGPTLLPTLRCLVSEIRRETDVPSTVQAAAVPCGLESCLLVWSCTLRSVNSVSFRVVWCGAGPCRAGAVSVQHGSQPLL